MSTTLRDSAVSLNAVLEQESEMLQQGRVSEIHDIAEQKLEAVSAFEAALAQSQPSGLSGQERGMVEQIIALAQANQRRLLAFRNGIKDLVARLSRIDGGAKIGAYGAGGQELSFASSGERYVRKV